MAQTTAIYRPRTPQKTDLFRLVGENLETFVDGYDEQFYASHGPLSVRAKSTFREFLRCGLLRYGFAKAICTQCDHKVLIAFSCQRRGVCPSCAQKRLEIFACFVRDEVLQSVPHRQFVFVLPKRLRCFFLGNGPLLTKLCQAMNESVTKFIQAGLDNSQAKPGILCAIQSFGDRLNPHPHLHCLISEGALFEGRFYPLTFSPKDLKVLTQFFAEKVFALLIKAKCITPLVQEQMRSWRHSGFSIDASVKIHPNEPESMHRLLKYIARNPIAHERLSYEAPSGKVSLYSSKKRKGKRELVAKYNALEFLALLALHIPPKGSHLLRYYGAYSSRTRSLAKEKTKDISLEDSPSKKAARWRWAQLIRLVYEVNPLACPRCGGDMKITAFVLKTKDIEDLLWELKIDEGDDQPRGPPAWLRALEAKQWIEEHPQFYPEESEFDPLAQEEVPSEAYFQDPTWD